MKLTWAKHGILSKYVMHVPRKLERQVKEKRRSQEFVYTQRLCYTVKLLVLRRDTKEQKLLRQVTQERNNLSYATRLNIKHSKRENMPKTL